MTKDIFTIQIVVLIYQVFIKHSICINKDDHVVWILRTMITSNDYKAYDHLVEISLEHQETTKLWSDSLSWMKRGKKRYEECLVFKRVPFYRMFRILESRFEAKTNEKMQKRNKDKERPFTN